MDPIEVARAAGVDADTLTMGEALMQRLDAIQAEVEVLKSDNVMLSKSIINHQNQIAKLEALASISGSRPTTPPPGDFLKNV